MEHKIRLAKIEVGKWLKDKDSVIKKLHRQLAQQQEATRQNAE